MTERSEALAQLARLLEDESLRSVSPERVSAVLAEQKERLAAALVDEAARSDDVFDRDSALAYLERRLDALATLIDGQVRTALLQFARDDIERW